MLEHPYDPQADPVLRALLAEAEADPDVLGLLLMGSRALGAASEESDYDVVFIVSDEALARYERDGAPARGVSVLLPIDTEDIWHDSPAGLAVERQVAWMLPAYAEALLLFDRTGEAGRAVGALRLMDEARARAEVEASYDGFLNQLYRSLKCWRRGDELGARLEASVGARALTQLLFALERRWCPYPSRLRHHLRYLDGQGWAPGELRDTLLDLAGTGDPRRQQALGRRVVALLRERGHHAVFESWGGKVERALGWEFPG